MAHKVVVVDIDGTVAHRSNRDIYDYSKVISDAPDPVVIEVVASLWKAGHKVVFVSGREDYCFDDTYKWLMSNCPPFIKLYLRKTGDFRSDEIVKKEIYENHIKDNFDVLCVIDDRQRVVDMWRSLGLKCLQVDKGDF